MLQWDSAGLQWDGVALGDGPGYRGPGDIGLRVDNIRSPRSCVLSSWLLPGCILSLWFSSCPLGSLRSLIEPHSLTDRLP